MKLCYFIGDQRYFYEFMDLNKFHALLSDTPHKPFYYYNSKIKLYEFLDSDKVAAVIENDNAVSIYDSLSEFKMVQEDADNNRVITEEILLNKNPYGKEFPQIAQQLIANILAELDVKVEEESIDLLKKVDLAINKTYKKRKAYLNDHIISIIALVGELLIKDFHGAKWEMLLADDNLTWNPYLYYSRRKIAIFVYLFESINDKQKKDTFILAEFYKDMQALMISKSK